MKTSPTRSNMSLCLVAAGLFLAPVVAIARDQVADSAVELLAYHGIVPVLTAGPYVERGTVRVQVAAKLGRPDVVLSDGAWLYHEHQIVDSAARGTLVVRFNDNRVATLLLATPAKVALLRQAAVETARRAQEKQARSSDATRPHHASHD